MISRFDGTCKVTGLPIVAGETEIEKIGGVWQVKGGKPLTEDEKISAELAKIVENQKFIIDNETAILAQIKMLDEEIRGYSFNSSSRVKAGLVRSAALLHHSLENAKQPSEQLVELQVRGLAAACKYVKEEM